MKTLSKSNFLIAITAIVLIATACKNTGPLEQRIAELVNDSTHVTRERDSLEKLLSQRIVALDTKTTQYDSLAKGISEMEARNKRLASSLNTRSADLKKAGQEKEELSARLAQTEADINNLRSEVATLQKGIDEREAAAAKQQEMRQNVERSLAESEQKRATDSASLASYKETLREREAVKGFENITSLSGAIGLGVTDVPYSARFIGIDNIFGYNINKSFLVGGGIGVNFYNGATMMPLYLDIRYYVSDNKTRPFFAGDGGVVMDLGNVGHSGVFLNPQFGLRRQLTDKFAFHITTGLWAQVAPESGRNAFITIKGGISFRPKK
ncbi:MAG TPA: hypothetical protein VK155_02230 [Bacteroidales bacterium]|nr:hypothetical protein [Bacteroidales bacterium]